MNLITLSFLVLVGVMTVGVCAELIKYRDVEFTVQYVNPKTDHLGLYWKDGAGVRFGSFHRLKDAIEARGGKLVFAMNAGIFSPEYVPMGLHVAEEKELSPLNLREGEGNFFLKPNGVFYLERGIPQIVDAAQYPMLKAHPSLAVQSGPLLVVQGKIHPAFRENSPNRYVRNGVGVTANQRVVLVFSQTPVTLYEFATFFKESLHCENALYLDGAISRVYAPASGSDFLEGDYAGILAVTIP